MVFLLNSANLLMVNLLMVIVNSNGSNGNLLMVLIYHFYSTTLAILSQKNLLEGIRGSENQQGAGDFIPLKVAETKGTHRTRYKKSYSHRAVHWSATASASVLKTHFSCPFKTFSRLQFLRQSPIEGEFLLVSLEEGTHSLCHHDDTLEKGNSP